MAGCGRVGWAGSGPTRAHGSRLAVKSIGCLEGSGFRQGCSQVPVGLVMAEDAKACSCVNCVKVWVEGVWDGSRQVQDVGLADGLGGVASLVPLLKDLNNGGALRVWVAQEER